MTDEELFNEIDREQEHFRWLNKVIAAEARLGNQMLLDRYLREIDAQSRLILKFKMILRGRTTK